MPEHHSQGVMSTSQSPAENHRFSKWLFTLHQTQTLAALGLRLHTFRRLCQDTMTAFIRAPMTSGEQAEADWSLASLTVPLPPLNDKHIIRSVTLTDLLWLQVPFKEGAV